jgi:hypothetical protein
MAHTAPVTLRATTPFTVTFANANKDLFVNYIDLWQIPTPETTTPLNQQQAKDTLLQRLDPNLTVPQRTLYEVGIPEQATNRDDPLEPLPLTPVFPQAVVHDLMALSTDWLLAGLEQLPPDTIAALETNPRFIEAFMVGLNHEMARELLWRGFPVNMQGTFFRRFWDPTLASSDTPDMPDITSWDPTAHLGDSFQTGGTAMGSGGQIVLVLRGELLRRYPEAIIHMVQAEWGPGNRYRRALANPTPDQDRYPILRFDHPPDMTFLFFNVPEHDARGSRDPNQQQPGWCFVFQQPPVLPFFGLGNVHSVDLATLQADIPARQGTNVPVNAASIAKAVLQEPLRVAIHADSLLPNCD